MVERVVIERWERKGAYGVESSAEEVTVIKTCESYITMKQSNNEITVVFRDLEKAWLALER